MDQRIDIFAGAEIDRDRDTFMRALLRELSGILQNTIGLEEAEGFIALVGNRIGAMMDDDYRRIANVEALDVHQVACALVDLKRRIQGGFRIESIDPEKIVFSNTACPFGDYVRDRQSLCMMTSNVFGRIAAANLDYARVELQDTIADGGSGCRVVVHLTEGDAGREYFG